MNLLQDTTALALSMCERYVTEKSIGVDCTCGRGFDTLWLAKKCAKVYSFDIQKEALSTAAELLDKEGISRGQYKCDDPVKVEFINDSHGRLAEYVRETPQIVIFNLGYLPGGDKNITTVTQETLVALVASLNMLAVGGLVSVTMYPGHPQGREEQEAVLAWAKGLDSSKYHCVYANMLNQKDIAPQVLWITKKK